MDDLNDIYKFYGNLGSGGFGSVFLVKKIKKKRRFFKDLTFPTLYALKIFKPDVKKEIFKREVEILTKLKDDNHFSSIVDIHKNVFYKGNIVYAILLKYIDGDTLKQYITKVDITKKLVENTAKQLLKITNILHGYGIIHRDLKPSNIMVHRGRLIVIDFGLSCYSTSPGVFNCERNTRGTKSYIAPEVYRNKVRDWKKVDIYSIGVILKKLFDKSINHPAYLDYVINNMLNSDPLKRFNIPTLLKIIKTGDITTRVQLQEHLLALCKNEVTELLPESGKLYFLKDNKDLYCFDLDDTLKAIDLGINQFTGKELNLDTQVEMRKWVDEIKY